jgi:hypothetical protein
MWYLPVIDRLCCIFRNPEDAQLMSWHASGDRTKDDDNLRHPSDARQWKHFGAIFPEFGYELRNVRFALSTDRVKLLSDLSSSHYTWLVILSIYNLSPWQCQKRNYLLLTILISGPKPLMEDMKNY